MSFADLKRKSQNNFSYLQKELEKSSSGKNVDDRFWKPEVDASGNGYAVIRFLPAPEGETIPWAKLYSHAFQGPGGWYIENSLTTLNEKDPVGEVNRRLWNSGSDEDKETARKQKRKLQYYSNIYVVKDPKHPENEGKVFLFRYGKKIYDKIMEAVNGDELEGRDGYNPFDFWTGANFKLRAKKVAGYPNYDSSEFESTGTLEDLDDAQLESIWKREFPLQSIVAPDQFKSYDQLQERLNSVLNLKNPEVLTQKQKAEPEEVVAATPVFNKEDDDSASQSSMVEEDDDVLDYFQKLADS